MQFKYPELLYALFLLIIPILIHLFQLRRFQKVKFTNVKFLKTIKLQTRKSSQLKKWLTLITRMLLLTCAVIAFAQPFIPNTEEFNEEQETVIYLDNSYSMQAKGSNGSLLNEAIQDLINSIPENEKFSLYTNTDTYRNTTLKALKNDLINLSYSPKQLNYEAAYLKGRQLFSNHNSATQNLVLISDFQQKENPLNFENDSVVQLKLVQPKPLLTTNLTIDSLFISNTQAETLDLTVKLSSGNDKLENVSVSLFNDDVLISKSAVDINEQAETVFTFPNNTIINGKLVVEDASLQYDNTFYFNINSKPKINVLSINGSTSDDSFLKRIYTRDEFSYSSFSIDALNFNLIPDQNLIVLNEIDDISNALIMAIKAFVNDGGMIVIIPSGNIILNSYNQLFIELNISNYTNLFLGEKRITTINYDHPLLKDAFYSRVTNFQYPKVNESFRFSSNSNSVLSYEDGTAFLKGNGNVYIFSAAINTTNSNFKSSPLIVPVLYNLGKQSLKLSQLYYHVGLPNTVDVNAILGQDDILTLEVNDKAVIPLQKTFSKVVEIKTDEYPSEAGIFNVKNKDEILQNISFNYTRDESKLAYHNLTNINFTSINTSVASTIDTIKSNTNVNALWKWFVIFALVFLIIEILILKYLK